MIETLCIAAEITAVLLLLSIGWPRAVAKQGRFAGDSGELGLDSSILRECQGSLTALRSLIFYQASQWVSSPTANLASTESDSSNADTIDADSSLSSDVAHRLRDHLKTIDALQLVKVDPITHLPERDTIEELLQTCEQWSPHIQAPVWVGLFQIDDIDPIDEKHGSVGSELACRNTAEYLREQLSGFGSLARIHHHAYAVALIGWSKEHAIEHLESVRLAIAHQAWMIGETELSLTASISMVAHQTHASFSDLWERLDDGIVDAVAVGGNRGRWYDASDSTWHPTGIDPVPEPTSEPSSNFENAETENPAERRPTNSESAQTKESKPTTSSDSGVMADDIAALFQAAQASKKPVPVPEKIAEPTLPKSVLSDSNEKIDVEKSKGEEPTTGDNIAALFRGAHSHAEAARVAKPPTNQAEEEIGQLKKVAKKAGEEPEVEAAMANDGIEALFAKFRTAPQPAE